MYGKIFNQIYKGTLAMVGPWEALVTFQQFIILADKEGIVDMTADAISRETTIPLEIIAKGIERLEQPDPESRSPVEEGRRIILLSETRSWGWSIVNYEQYRKLRTEEDRRAYHREYWHKRQAKKKANTQQSSTNTTNSRGRGKGRGSKEGADAPDFESIDNLNMKAWEKWLAYRQSTNKAKYKTTGRAKALAKLPHEMQMLCVESSIDQMYVGIFPESFNGKASKKLTYAEQLKADMDDAGL